MTSLDLKNLSDANIMLSVMESMSDAIAAIDMQFNVLALNPAYQGLFYRFFGKHVKIGSNILDLLSDQPEHQAQSAENWGRVLRGEPFTMTRTFVIQEQRRHYELSFTPLQDDDSQTVGAFQMVHEITASIAEENSRNDHYFKAIFDNTFQFTGLLSPAGTVLETNARSLEFTGLTLDDVVGKAFWEIPWWGSNTPEMIEKLKNAVHKAAQGYFVRDEVEARARDGSVLPVDFSIKPVVDDIGEIRFLLPEGRLIVEQKQNQQELKTMFDATFEQAAVGIAHVTTDGHFLRLNRRFCEILGYSHEELITKTYQEITHPEDLEKDELLYYRLKAREMPVYTLEKRYIRKDGTTVWIELTVSIVWGENGEFKYAISVVQDINARKEAEAELKQMTYRQKLLNKLSQQALSNASLDRVWMMGIQIALCLLNVDYGIILELDGKTGQIIYRMGEGFPDIQNKESLGEVSLQTQSGYTVLMDETLVVENYETDPHFSLLPALKKSGLMSGVTTTLYRDSHQRIFGSLNVYSSRPREYTANEVNFLQSVASLLSLAIERSESEQKLRHFAEELEQRVKERTRELEEATTQKSWLLTMVSHDFKNPLNGIIGYTQMLNEGIAGELSQKQSEFIQQISNNSYHLLDLVTNVLDTARITAGKLVFEPQKIRTKVLIEEIRQIITPAAERQQVNFQFDIEPSLSYVRQDPQYFRQILLNLIHNAIRYNRPNGHVIVRMYTNPRQGRLICRVEDSGTGIPNEKLAKLFTEYYRTAEAHELCPEGTGLGLANVKKLIELQGGAITVTSEEGKGSVFSVQLPLLPEYGPQAPETI